MSTSRQPIPPSLLQNFTFSPTITEFSQPLTNLLPTHPSIKAICTGGLIFTSSTPPQILLLQRAPTDSYPLKWEIPGGAVDVEDASILHGLVREVWEETGLVVSSVKGVVDAKGLMLDGDMVDGLEGRGFRGGKGELWWKVEFVCVAEEEVLDVCLDPSEHVDFRWAREEEVRAGKLMGIGWEKDLVFTSPAQVEVILRGFEMIGEMSRVLNA